jgi:7-carboxy-7-deazaguanine synthase
VVMDPTPAEPKPNPSTAMYALSVNEVFGPTWQGEGLSAGQLCAFLRLAGCNLHCNWCDTPYTWAWSRARADLHRDRKVYDVETESHMMAPQDAAREVLEHLGEGELIVISGGEPMLQQRGIREFIHAVHTTCAVTGLKRDIRFEIETNGTRPITLDPLMLPHVQLNVSPKLPSSGNTLEEAIDFDVLADYVWWPNRVFKFVVVGELDIMQVAAIQQKLGLPSRDIWIMPEGIDRWQMIEKAQRLIPLVLKMGWNLTLRQHILLWDNVRGK